MNPKLRKLTDAVHKALEGAERLDAANALLLAIIELIETEPTAAEARRVLLAVAFAETLVDNFRLPNARD